jgi:hypothetical protein
MVVASLGARRSALSTQPLGLPSPGECTSKATFLQHYTFIVSNTLPSVDVISCHKLEQLGSLEENALVTYSGLSLVKSAATEFQVCYSQINRLRAPLLSANDKIKFKGLRAERIPTIVAVHPVVCI